jgi:predicted permease
MEALLSDIRYGVRGLRRSPLFAAAVALTIGIGLGILCSAFAVFNAYVLRPFPVHDPHSLYEFSRDTKTARHEAFTWREYTHLQGQSDVFSELFATRTFRLTVDGHPFAVELVSSNYFSMLGVDAVVGRTFVTDDATAPGARAVAVLSYETWKNRFGSDPAILGKQVRVMNRPFEVIGVANAQFRGLEDLVNGPPNVWVPVTMARELSPDLDIFGPGQAKALRVIGRLRADMSAEQALARLDAWARQTTVHRAEGERPIAVRLEARATRVALTPGVVGFFSTMMVAFGLILLIACANVTGLMLARGLARQREIGIKLSLGARRGRLVRQLLVESLILALPAAVIAAGMMLAIARLIPYLLLTTLPEEAIKAMSGLIVPLDPDVRVYGFVILAATLSAVAFGIVPALQLTRLSLRQAVSGEIMDRVTPMRVRNGLVIAQLTTCTMLFVSAVGLLQGVRDAARQDTRLDVASVLDGRVPEKLRTRVAQTLAGTPAIARLAVAWRPPLYGPLRLLSVIPSGTQEEIRVGYNLVSPTYFDVFGIPILRGRSFTGEEADARAAVAVVSAATAQRLWPGADPLEQTIRITEARLPPGQMAPQEATAQVIGVVGDVVSGLVREGVDTTCVYFPIGAKAPGELSLLLRSRTTAAASRAAFENAVNTLGGEVARQLIPIEQVLTFQTWPLRATGAVAIVLSIIALVFALSGCYGVVSFLLSQRVKEFGIRLALGATSSRIVRDALVSSTRLVGYGVLAGVLLAFGLLQLARSTFEILPQFHVFAYAAAAVFVLAATVAAAYGPCRRAGKIEPVTALRHE